jgi:hypothetical protein
MHHFEDGHDGVLRVLDHHLHVGSGESEGAAGSAERGVDEVDSATEKRGAHF